VDNANVAKRRCAWARGNDLLIEYHDTEWGVPVHRDQRLFEFLILEGAQAGLSWSTILVKRQAYRRAYDHFNVDKVACYRAGKINTLLADAGIVRNRLKIKASIDNARAFQRVQREFGSFNRYVWQFVGGQPKQNRRHNAHAIPATTPESDALSRDLRRRGFKFTGSTICYAFMQAVGMVNDHTIGCFRHLQVCRLSYDR
jgi:DNA-3-methyladenine glycosylase I